MVTLFLLVGITGLFFSVYAVRQSVLPEKTSDEGTIKDIKPDAMPNDNNSSEQDPEIYVAPESDNAISFAIGGDVMLDRGVDTLYRGDKLITVAENLGQSIFGDKDVAILNCEGPISLEPIVADNTANNLNFNFPPKSIDLFKWLGIDGVSLANNHSYNQGKEGFRNTVSSLEAVGIKPIGKESGFDESSIGRFQRGNATIAIFAINILETADDISKLIADEKLGGSYILIFPHWGIEYSETHSEAQEKLAKRWIDAGADLVVGSHPHVTQDVMVYRGRPIIFSLGNLIFDQTFSEQTQRGLIITGLFTKGSVKLTLIPTVSKRMKPEKLVGDERGKIIQRFDAAFQSQGQDGSYTFNWSDK